MIEQLVASYSNPLFLWERANVLGGKAMIFGECINRLPLRKPQRLRFGEMHVARADYAARIA